mgnify:CR=1 FL=1
MLLFKLILLGFIVYVSSDQQASGNTIPNERKTFLENVGIECKEIPVSQLVNIADKYQYTFLDAKQHESEDLDLSSEPKGI